LLAIVVANLGSDPPVVETLPSVAAAESGLETRLLEALALPFRDML